MDKYEISLWEDVPVENGDSTIFAERKIAVIGSDTMEGQVRALEPNLVEELNGSNTFTFKMYYTYVDNITGEKYNNPFSKYLVNERKIKVYWKDKWYDLVIKKCQEDSAKKSVTYTCKDLFINELSKNGYSLEFDTDLQNNIGTAEQLAKKILEGSTWQYDTNAGEHIIQKSEGPVYEVKTQRSFSATWSPSFEIEESAIVSSTDTILVFYDSLVGLEGTVENKEIQFLYRNPYEKWYGVYTTDVNNMLVTNAVCFSIFADCTRFTSDENNTDLVQVRKNGELLFTINLNTDLSQRYRGERLVRSQVTEFDPLLNRYVLLCKDEEENEVYEVATTKYTNPLTIVNLVANPTEFTSTIGWMGAVDEFGIYPKFSTDTELATYTTKSYLKIHSGDIYNTGIQSNISYLKPTQTELKQGAIGGIQVKEKYVFRIKAKEDPSTNDYITIDENNLRIIGNLYQYNSDYTKNGNPLFINPIYQNTSDGWAEVTYEARESISAEDINKYGLFLQSQNTYWIENVQFFKYSEGATSYDEDAEIKRINPGEIAVQSIVTPVYKYYYKNNDAETAEELTYLYVGETESSDYTPVYNNYEKIGTINEKESNRFNLLQTIAETFQAWVKFRIDHEDNGAIKFINGIPQKYVYFVSEVGVDTGISFEYGIDLKTISRTIDSDKIATKVIIKPNNNEFAPHGYCSIQQTNQNYSKENFILNLDYYTQQGLLDRSVIYDDLYNTQQSIGYYRWLHTWNSEYDDITNILLVKNADLTRQEAQKKVYEQYLLAAHQQLDQLESDLITLAEVSSWAEVEDYARAHASNETVQALLNAHGTVESSIEDYEKLLAEANETLSTLQSYINELNDRQAELLVLIKNKHQQFNNKYFSYIMEGVWQDENYIDPTEYFLDGLSVAYTSSRPQLTYNINVLRLSSLEDYSSKVINLGDICYMQDTEFFGYLDDRITPYKEKILVSKVSSFFDSPEKDVLTIQNYRTRFDDLFQRIAAVTQSLVFSEGAYARAAETINNSTDFQDVLYIKSMSTSPTMVAGAINVPALMTVENGNIVVKSYNVYQLAAGKCLMSIT